MQDTHDFPFQLKLKEFFRQRLKLILLLSSCHQTDQNLPCRISPPQKKVAQVSHMLHFLITADMFLLKILQHTDKNFIHIFMDQPAVRRGKDVIGASFLMKSQ